MTRVYVELSGEAPPLAVAEAVGASEALGGRPSSRESEFANLFAVELPGERVISPLAKRLALARRCLISASEGIDAEAAASQLGARSLPASFRRIGRPSGAADERVHAVARQYVAAGGQIDLDHPRVRFYLADDQEGCEVLLREAARVDRAQAGRRRMPFLPFQRPVSLPPRLARAAANLGRIRPGDRVLDPFLGTGALLAEAGMLGAHLYGIDRDATMVRGAMRNLEFFGLSAEQLLVGDAGEVEFPETPVEFDAVLTDPPYGRSSSTRGESPDDLVTRVVPRWAERVRKGGVVVLVVPTGAADLPSPWQRRVAVPVRVHGSLTREFRTYERGEGRR